MVKTKVENSQVERKGVQCSCEKCNEIADYLIFVDGYEVSLEKVKLNGLTEAMIPEESTDIIFRCRKHS